MNNQSYNTGRRAAMRNAERRKNFASPLDQKEYNRGYDTFLAQEAKEQSRPKPALTADELRDMILGFADVFRGPKPKMSIDTAIARIHTWLSSGQGESITVRRDNLVYVYEAVARCRDAMIRATERTKLAEEIDRLPHTKHLQN
jgi:hypothetical protein